MPSIRCPVSSVLPGLSSVERKLVGFCKTSALYTDLKSQIGRYMTNLSQARGSSAETNTDTYLEMWVTDCGLLILGMVASKRMKSVAYTYFKSVKERCNQYGVRYPFLKV